MHLYKVTINMPVHVSPIYVVAMHWNEAANAAMQHDAPAGQEARNGGIDRIERLGPAAGRDSCIVVPPDIAAGVYAATDEQ